MCEGAGPGFRLGCIVRAWCGVADGYSGPDGGSHVYSAPVMILKFLFSVSRDRRCVMRPYLCVPSSGMACSGAILDPWKMRDLVSIYSVS
jgi:hypothetical protein